jgi:hypothetical protein
VRYEVEDKAGQPLDSTARQFLDGVIRSANKDVAYRAQGEELVVTVEANAIGEAGAIRQLSERWPASIQT